MVFRDKLQRSLKGLKFKVVKSFFFFMRFFLVKAHDDPSRDWTRWRTRFNWRMKVYLHKKCCFSSPLKRLSISADTTSHFYFYLTRFCYVFFINQSITNWLINSRPTFFSCWTSCLIWKYIRLQKSNGLCDQCFVRSLKIWGPKVQLCV